MIGRVIVRLLGLEWVYVLELNRAARVRLLHPPAHAQYCQISNPKGSRTDKMYIAYRRADGSLEYV
jgi:hypothetical protein